MAQNSHPTISTLSVSQFLRLADRLSIPASLLLLTEEPEAEPDHPDDPTLLGALLTELGNHTQLLIVADALGWEVTRVHAAADALIRTLEAAGLTVFRDGGRISIRAVGDTHQDAAVKVTQDPRLPYAQRVLTPARTRKVYRALHGQLSEHAFGDNDRRDLAMLKRVGVLAYDTDRAIVPTSEVLRSLHPDGSID